MYVYIDRLLQELKNTEGITIQELSILCALDKRIVADTLVGLHVHLQWVTAQDIFGNMLTKHELKGYKQQFLRLDHEIKWRFRKEHKQIFTSLNQKDEALLGQLLSMIGHPEILKKYGEWQSAPQEFNQVIHSNVESMKMPEILLLIQEAIHNKKIIKVKYLDRFQRLIPYHIHQNDDNHYYYMIGHAAMRERDGLVHFRCDKMSELEIQETKYNPSFSKLDVFRFVSKYINQDESVIEDVHIVVYRNGTKTIKETLNRYGRFCNIEYDDSENLILKGKIYGRNAFKRYLRSMGSSVKVIAPLELVIEMKNSYLKSLDNYKKYTNITQ